jgi:hypothetical protein
MRERQGLEHETAALELPARGLPLEREGPRARTSSRRKAPQAPPLPLVCAQPSPWPDAPCDRSRPSAETARRRVARLAEVMVEGVLTTKLHDKSPAGPGLFAGSWDWHSAVHAHWALLCIARVRKLASIEDWLSKRLTDAALRAERNFLAKSGSGFEMPYGRAWLLMVLFELARRGRKSSEVTALTSQTQEQVVGWLERTDFPEDKQTGKLRATHGSWLFAYLLVALSEPASTKITDRLRALRKAKLDAARSKIAAFKPAKSDFMDLPAVLALTDRVDPIFPGAPGPLAYGALPALDDPPLDDSNAHSAGTALVQVWPHAVQSHRGDKQACSRFYARMNEMFSRPDHWADSFELVAHWVPQFMWMGLWLEAGRP